jgi:hypothetical protein
MQPGRAGDLTLTSLEFSIELIGVDAQEQLAGFEPKACVLSIAHMLYFLVPSGRQKKDTQTMLI